MAPAPPELHSTDQLKIVYRILENVKHLSVVMEKLAVYFGIVAW